MVFGFIEELYGDIFFNYVDLSVALFTKILTINYARERKFTISFLFTKILTRILAVKSVVTLRQF